MGHGSSGADIADLQRRLRAAGHSPGAIDGRFSDLTAAAVRSFQEAAGLDVDAVCGITTWSALVEAGFGFGTRLLCLRSPMMRGNDVSELQLRLGALGFDAGRVDGIFGPTTQQAVGEFQRNAGLVRDEVCGPETVAHLLRLQTRGGTASVAGVRERDYLRRRSGALDGLDIALGSVDGSGTLMAELASELERSGCRVHSLSGDWHDQAARTNDVDADLYLAVVLADSPSVETAYYARDGYSSSGGHQLATLVLGELPVAPGWTVGIARGQQLPILRETRPPAVLVRLGTPQVVEENRDLVIASLARALDAWSRSPVETPG